VAREAPPKPARRKFYLDVVKALANLADVPEAVETEAPEPQFEEELVAIDPSAAEFTEP